MDDMGTVTNAAGPAAKQKALELDAQGAAPPGAPQAAIPGYRPPTPQQAAGAPMQPDPELLAATQPIDDPRLAMNGEDAVRSMLGANAAGGQVPPGAALPMRTDLAGAGPALAPMPPISRVLTPEQAAQLKMGGGAGDIPVPRTEAEKVAGALGVRAPEIPNAVKPTAGGRNIAPGKVIMADGPAGASQMAPASPGKLIPAHEARTGRKVERTIVPEEDKQNIGAAKGLELEATDKIVEADVNRAEALANTYRDETARIDDWQAHAQEAEARRQNQIQAKYAEVDRLNSELANEKIDAKAFWADKSAGEKFAAAIAVGLGAFAAGMNGGPNHAANILDKAIEQNIDAQKANLDNKRKSAQGAQSMIGMYREILGDERAATLETRKTLLEAAARHIDQTTKESESPLIRARGDALKASIYEKYAKTNAELDAYKQHEMYKEVAAQVVGGPPKQQFVNNDGSFLDLPGGVSIKASDPAMVNQWRQQFDGVGEIEDASAELKQILASPNVKNTARAKMLVNNIATSLGAAKMGSARMTGQGELENIGHILDTGNGPISSDVLGRTRAALEAVDATAAAAKRRIINSAPRYTRAIPDGKGGLVRMPLGDAPQQRDVKVHAVE